MLHDERIVHTCNECEAEFIVESVYDEFEEFLVSFCPSCGAPLDEEDEDEDEVDEDKYF